MNNLVSAGMVELARNTVPVPSHSPLPLKCSVHPQGDGWVTIGERETTESLARAGIGIEGAGDGSAGDPRPFAWPERGMCILDALPSVPFRKFAFKSPRSFGNVGQMWEFRIKESARRGSSE